jgi:thioredoxin-like negative regulator of GroEL
MNRDEPCVAVDNIRDLEQVLARSSRVVALVYVTWCPYCRKALPAFEKQNMEGTGSMLLVADDEENVADLYGIDVFPTLLLFEKGMIVKRLDARPGLGLNEKQIADFVASCVMS